MDAGDDVFRGSCPICETGNRPKERFHAKVLHLARDDDEVGEYRLWSFGSKLYQQLSGIAAAVGDVAGVDLILKCVDQKFQAFDVYAAEDRLEVDPDPESDFEIGPIVEEPSYEQLAAQYVKAVSTVWFRKPVSG